MQEIKAILRQQKNEHHEHLAAQVRDSSPATKQRVMDLLRKRVRRRGWLHCRWRIRVLTQTEFNAMMLLRLCFYVSLFVCLFVCLSFARITQKVLHWFLWTVVEMLAIDKGPILLHKWIWLTIGWQIHKILCVSFSVQKK